MGYVQDDVFGSLLIHVWMLEREGFSFAESVRLESSSAVWLPHMAKSGPPSLV